MDEMVRVVRCGDCELWIPIPSQRYPDCGKCCHYGCVKHKTGYCDRGERRADRGQAGDGLDRNPALC